MNRPHPLHTLIVVAVLLLSIATNAFAQESAYSLIEKHREWMRTSYPKAEDLSQSQLLREAAFAIVNELKEPEAIALLHAVGKNLAEVEAYAAFEESGEKDYRFAHALPALEQLYHWAERQLGRGDATTGWCKYLWLNTRSNMEKTYPLMDAAIKEQEEWAKKTDDEENAALVCLLKFLKFETSTEEHTICLPDLYAEVLQTEKEAVKLYPIADNTPSHMRAWLYMAMGRAKDKFSQPYETEEAYGEVGLVEESLYNRSVSTGILTNADHYFCIAEASYLQLYTAGHPEVVELYTAMEFAKENSCTISEANVDVNKNLYDYAAQYYGQGHLSTILHKLNLWYATATRGGDINDAFMWHTMTETLARYLGEANINFTSVLSAIVDVVSLYYPTDFDEVSRLFDQTVARTFGADNMKSAYTLYNIYGTMKDSHPEVYKEKAVPLIEFYTQHHDKSTVSILLGRRIATDTYLGISDRKKGTEIQQMVYEDTQQRYGDKSYVYLQEKAQYLNWLASYDSEHARQQYPLLIEQLKANNIDYSEVLGDYATLENGAGNLQLAARLYQQAYNESEENGNTHKRAYLLLSKLSILPLLHTPVKEQEAVYAEAKKILDTNRDTLTWLPINYNLAADWLSVQKRYKESLDMTNRGIEVCDLLQSGFRPQYIILLTRRYNLYMYQLNDMSTAYKLMEEDINAFEKQSFRYYTTDMLDYLWSVYNLLPKSTDDIFTTIKFLNLIMKMTFNIAEQNNFELNYIAYYGVRALYEYVNFGIFTNNIISQLNIETYSEEVQKNFKKACENSFGILNDLLDNYLNAENLLTKLEKSIPNYTLQAGYFNLLSTLENIFFYLKPDKEKALKYLDIHMKQSKETYPAEFRNACFTAFDFYVREHEYEKAETLYDKNLKPLEKDETLAESYKLALYSRMCFLNDARHDFEGMLTYARKFYQSMRSILDTNFHLFTEQEQNAFMATNGDPANWLTCSLARLDERKDIVPEVYDAVLYRTGMQLRSQAETRNAILKSSDKELIALVDSLNMLRSLQKGISYDITTEAQESLNKKYAEVADYQQRINMLERDIIAKSAVYRNKTPLDATWEQVRGKLRQGEAAIEFIYAHPYWMALVVKPDGTAPIAIKLTNADSLSAKMTALNAPTPTVMARKLYDNADIDLYGMLWRPLEHALKGVSKVFYATQGMLSSIAFAAISTPDNNYLVDRYDLCPLTTTAQLLLDEEERQPKSITLMGDIYYSDKQEEQVRRGDISTARGDDDTAINDFSDRGSKRYHFKYLPFTQTEVKKVEETFKGKSVFVRRGTQATESCLRKQLLTKPDIVHLATHGFFIANDVAALNVPFFKRYTKAASNSMQRAGVTLAGAEDTWNGSKTPDETDDGILTANEVAQIDLSGTQLVTLSACETALGNYNFEGVFGLPRGFKQAGVKSLLVSLWSVNDKSTAMLMTAFYRYWTQGATKHEAFRKAVADVRKDYPAPYYWAPFLLLDAIR